MDGRPSLRRFTPRVDESFYRSRTMVAIPILHLCRMAGRQSPRPPFHPHCLDSRAVVSRFQLRRRGPLHLDEIPAIVDSFASASRKAIEAGFDGVELQAANSHLIDQFLEDGSNTRSDAYGGSIVNRMRFLLEITESVTAAIGSERLGVRLSPFGQYGGICDSNPMQLFVSIVKELNQTKPGIPTPH